MNVSKTAVTSKFQYENEAVQMTVMVRFTKRAPILGPRTVSYDVSALERSQSYIDLFQVCYNHTFMY